MGRGSGGARGYVKEKFLWFLGLVGVSLMAERPGRKLEGAVLYKDPSSTSMGMH